MSGSRPRSGAIFLFALLLMAAAGCDRNNSDDDAPETAMKACDSAPEVMTTADGVEFVRSPDSCFEAISDWPYDPEYVEIDGLRQAYVDEGSPGGQVVLLLHGQPSWSYLYRKMIPVLAEAGYRVIAMDHLGMGRSDKPTDIEAYTYVGHSDRLLEFIEALGLEDITLFGQDWGGVLGLRVAGMNPERFARIAIGNSTLRDAPAGEQLYPPVEDPNEVEILESRFERIPAQQPLLYFGCQRRFPRVDNFASWMVYAMKAESFRPSEVLEAGTWFDLPDDDEAAYDAPFPSRAYMAGIRTFPSLINEVAGQNAEAWSGLSTFDRPFVTLWGANDAGGLGDCERQDLLICAVPGAAGEPHARIPAASHFLQDDQGAEIARRLVAFMEEDPSVEGNHEATCESGGLPETLQTAVRAGAGRSKPWASSEDSVAGRDLESRTEIPAAPLGGAKAEPLRPALQAPGATDSGLERSSVAPPAVPFMAPGLSLLLTGLLVRSAFRSFRPHR